MGHHHDIPIPRVALLGAGLLLALTIFVAATGDHGGVVAQGQRSANAELYVSLGFRDRDVGGVEVVNAKTGQVLEVFEPGTNGFARSVLRGLVRDRRARGIESQSPFDLRSHEDGRVTLSDPLTGRIIELVAFGADNVGVFAAYLTAGENQS